MGADGGEGADVAQPHHAVVAAGEQHITAPLEGVDHLGEGELALPASGAQVAQHDPAVAAAGDEGVAVQLQAAHTRAEGGQDKAVGERTGREVPRAQWRSAIRVGGGDGGAGPLHAAQGEG